MSASKNARGVGRYEGARSEIFLRCAILTHYSCDSLRSSYASVKDRDGNVTKWKSALPIVLATGFSLSTSMNCLLQNVADWDDTGRPVLSVECDEVKRTKNVFVVGPMVKHVVDMGKGGNSCAKLDNIEAEQREMIRPETVIFCFVYKFKCR